MKLKGMAGFRSLGYAWTLKIITRISLILLYIELNGSHLNYLLKKTRSKSKHFLMYSKTYLDLVKILDEVIWRLCIRKNSISWSQRRLLIDNMELLRKIFHWHVIEKLVQLNSWNRVILYLITCCVWACHKKGRELLH